MAQQKRVTIADRVKGFLTGGNFVPSLDSIFDSGVMEQLIVEEYRSKPSQVGANIGWVYTANQAISDDAGAVQVKLFRQKSDGDQEEVRSHEVLDLLKNPNNALTSKQFWSLYHSYLNLTGESYILKLDRKGNPLEDTTKLPSALFPIPAHLAEFKIGTDNWEQSTVSYNGNVYPISAILRDINPDPENPYVGMSIVRKASLTIDTDIQMKRWNNKLFKNGARPGVVVEVPDRMSDDEYKRFKEEFDTNYSGTSNSFKRLILEGGATIKPFMMSTQDLDFLESKRFTRDEILAMFRVSTSNIGITEDVNRANAEAQEYQYAKRIIKPRLEQRIDFLNARFLKPIYGDELVLGFEEVVPEDRTQRLSEANGGINKWLTIDEVRDLYGYEELPDGLGKELYVPINSIPLSTVTGGLSIELPPTTPAPEPTEEGEEDSEEAKGTDPKADEKRTKEYVGEAKVKAYTARSLAYEKLILRTSRAMFNKQKQDALDWLDRTRGSKGVDLTKKDWAEDMIDWDSYKQAYDDDLNKIIEMIITEMGTEAYTALVNQGSFDPYQPNVQRYINDASLRASVNINDETKKQIRATLAQGLRENESVQELSGRVTEVFGTASTSRAYMIAATESATAQNVADVLGWEQTGVVESKEWYTAKDETTCLFCNDMHGRIKHLSETFFNEGDVQVVDDKRMNLRYRNIGEPPLHPHCRCVLLPVVNEI